MTSMPFNLIGLAKLSESRQQEARNKVASQGGDDFAALLREKADSNRWQSLGAADTRSATWRRSSYDAGMTAWHNDAPDAQPKQPPAPSDHRASRTDKPHDRHDDRAGTAHGKSADSAHESQDKASTKDAAKAHKDGDKADDDATTDTATATTDAKQQAGDGNSVDHQGKKDSAADQQTGQHPQDQRQQAAQDGQPADGQTASGAATDSQMVDGGLTVTAVPVTAVNASASNTGTTGTPSTLPDPATADVAGKTDPVGQAAPQQAALPPGLQLNPEADLPDSGSVSDGKTKAGTAPVPGTTTAIDGATTQDPLTIEQILVPVGKSANAPASIADDNPLTAGPHKGLAEKDSRRDPAKIDTVRAPQAVVQATQPPSQPSAAPVGPTQDNDAGARIDFGNGDFGSFDNGTGTYGGFGAWPMPSMLAASNSKQADFVAALKQQLGNTPLQEQVAVHMQRAARDGVDKISIQLSPEELGRIHVKMDIDDDKKVRATVTVERPATLDLLQRDSRALERALHDAGLKTDSGSLSFNLQRGNTGDFSGSGDWGQGGRQSSRTSGQAGIAGPADRIPAASAPEIDTANGLVDVEV
jgi:hypothetical protein